MNVDPASSTFVLLGHDCPIGEYPSVVVPVGKQDSALVAAYEGGTRAELVNLSPDAKFVPHSQAVLQNLAAFNWTKHGLFAISEQMILIYPLDQRASFFSDLLRSPIAALIEPYYRLSLAAETKDRQLISPLLQARLGELRKISPEFADQWADQWQDYLQERLVRPQYSPNHRVGLSDVFVLLLVIGLMIASVVAKTNTVVPDRYAGIGYTTVPAFQDTK